MSTVRVEPHPRFAWVRIPAILAWTAAGVLLVAAGYETLQALGVLAIGPQPGERPTGEGLVLDIAVLTLAGGGLALLLLAAILKSAAPVPVRALQALSLSAAAFAIAHWSSYDPYYAPSLRRMSDGIIGRGWIIALVALTVLAISVAMRRGRAGVALTGAVLWLAGWVALLAGLGH